GGGRVIAAVIDIDDLVIDQSVERGGDLGDKRRDIAGLVFDRNDDRKFHAVLYCPLPPPALLSGGRSPKRAGENRPSTFRYTRQINRGVGTWRRRAGFTLEDDRSGSGRIGRHPGARAWEWGARGGRRAALAARERVRRLPRVDPHRGG